MSAAAVAIGNGVPVCYDATGNVQDCGSAGPSSTCFDGSGDEVDCSSYSAVANVSGSQANPQTTGALSANSGSTGGGAAPAVASNGTGIASLFASLAQVGASTYV